MKNLYDLETDLDIEDIDQEYEEDEEEEYEDISEFGQYDPEDAKTRWGDLDFEELVAELQRYYETSKKYFFSKKKRVINAEEVTHLLQYIDDRFPTEIKDAKKIISDKDAILSRAKQTENDTVNKAQTYYKDTINQAKQKAEDIIAAAKAQAEELVASHTITQSARERAEEIKAQCYAEREQTLKETDALCEQHKQEARDWAQSITDASFKFLQQSLHDYQNVAKTNMKQIMDVYQQCSERYDIQKQKLESDSRVND